MLRESLWGSVQLPPWKPRSPALLYALFRRKLQRPLAPRHVELLALLLMHVVSIQFNRHRWNLHLRRCGLCAEDVAQEVLFHLLRKIDVIRPRADGWRPFLAILNTSIYNFVKSRVRDRLRVSSRESLASDCGEHFGNGGHGGRWGGFDEPQARSENDPSSGELDVGQLARMLAAARGPVLAGIGPRGSESAGAVYTYLCRRLVEGHEVVPHERLPESIRREVSLERHGLIAARLIRAVRRYADDSGAQPSIGQ